MELKLFYLFLLISLVLTSCQAKPKSKKEKKKKEVNNTKDFLLAQKSSSSLAVKTDDDDNDDTSSDLISRSKDDQTSSFFGFETEEVVAGAPSCGKRQKKRKRCLMKYRRLESCCHTHKKCPLQLAPKKEKWGINNNVDFPIYDCKCDRAFYQCLKTIKKSAGYLESGLAWIVGKGYFDTYETPCVAIPDGVNKKEKAKPMKDDGTKTDAANNMNNNDNKPKARLVRAKSYSNENRNEKDAQKSNTARDDNVADK